MLIFKLENTIMNHKLSDSSRLNVQERIYSFFMIALGKFTSKSKA
jgi:hypothetical protein